MPTTYTYRPQAAVGENGELTRDGSGQLFAITDTAFATPLVARDIAGANKTVIGLSGIGQTETFLIDDHPELWWKSGSTIVHLFSVTGIISAVDAALAAVQASASAALSAAASAETSRIAAEDAVLGGGGGGGGAVTWGSILQKPSSFIPTAHTHGVAAILDMTEVGKSLALAASKQDARAAIGAGTGNGTSNLVLGSTAGTAAPGNHAHGAASVTFTPPSGSPLTATNVQDAIAQAAATGGSGGGGSSPVWVWRFAAGAYPTPPATKPSGVSVVLSIGPEQPAPAVIASWMGLGAAQAVLLYDWVPLT